MSRSDKGDSLPSGAGREFTSGLRDYSGSLEKGAGCEQREQTEGLKGIALFIQIPYAPKKSLRLALTATHLPLQGRQNPSGLRQVRRQPLRSDCAKLQIKTSVRSCSERGKKNPRSVVNTDRWTFVILTFYQPITVEPALSLLTKPIQDLPVLS